VVGTFPEDAQGLAKPESKHGEFSMIQPRVKFCGVRRVEDALRAVELGVDAIGLVFVARSPRAVELDRAAEICRALPALVSTVGLFMDAEPDQVRATLARVPLNWLQFHGSESPEYCADFARPWIKALPMASPDSVQYDRWDQASALLLDAHVAGAMGGSGRRFDWDSLKPPNRPWILAGGLSPDNIAEAVRRLSPPAVDVSSGIEAQPGVKSPALMEQFMERIKHG